MELWKAGKCGSVTGWKFLTLKLKKRLTVSLMAIEDSMFAISWLNASVVAADGMALEAGGGGGAVASVGWDAVGVVVPAEVVLEVEVGMLQERIHWTQKGIKSWQSHGMGRSNQNF